MWSSILMTLFPLTSFLRREYSGKICIMIQTLHAVIYWCLWIRSVQHHWRVYKLCLRKWSCILFFSFSSEDCGSLGWLTGRVNSFMMRSYRCTWMILLAHSQHGWISPQRHDGQEKGTGCNRTDSALAPICGMCHWDEIQISLLYKRADIFLVLVFSRLCYLLNAWMQMNVKQSVSCVTVLSGLFASPLCILWFAQCVCDSSAFSMEIHVLSYA